MMETLKHRFLERMGVGLLSESETSLSNRKKTSVTRGGHQAGPGKQQEAPGPASLMKIGTMTTS